MRRPSTGPVGGEVAGAACPRVVVAGLGNEYRHDDGAGPLIASRIVGRAPDVVNIGPMAEPLDLLGRWDTADLVVVIDATRSDVAPSTVRVIDLAAGGDSDDRSTSTHGIGLRGVLRLARAVGGAPRRVIVVGIEGDDFGRGMGLSTAVATAVEGAVRTNLDVIREVAPCG